jgi:hypothetical protein
MDDRYRALLRQTADVIQTKIVTRANRARAHAVIVEFAKSNPEMTYGEVAGVFGLHPVTVNRIALRAGQKRGSGRRRGKLARKTTAPMEERKQWRTT